MPEKPVIAPIPWSDAPNNALIRIILRFDVEITAKYDEIADIAKQRHASVSGRLILPDVIIMIHAMDDVTAIHIAVGPVLGCTTELVLKTPSRFTFW
jgi:hypothetical protein